MASTLAIAALLACLCVTRLQAKDAWVEDFDDIGAWKPHESHPPAKMEVRDGLLSVEKGAEDGSCIAIGTGPIVDLERYRYLVIRMADISGDGTNSHQFRCQGIALLADGKKIASTGCRFSVFARNFADPTVIVVDFHNPLANMREKGQFEIQLQGVYPNTRFSVDSIKITDALNEKDKVDWEATRKRILSPDAKPFQGLKERAKRRGWMNAPFRLARKPPLTGGKRVASTEAGFESDKVYLGERLVFRDTVTGAPVWRLTEYPLDDNKGYMDMLHWNADGSVLRFMTRRGGTGTWFMDADGSNLRTWNTGIPVEGWFDGSPQNRSYGGIRLFKWHEQNPDLFFYGHADGKTQYVYSVNVKTGERKKVIEFEAVDDSGTRFNKPNPDGTHFLFNKIYNYRKVGEHTRLYVANTDGEVHSFLFPYRVEDKIRFAKDPENHLHIAGKFKLTKDGGRVKGETHIISKDGKVSVRVPDAMGGAHTGHHGWTGSGKWLLNYYQNNIYAHSLDLKEVKLLMRLFTGGHLGCALDDRSVLTDVWHNGPWSGGLVFMDIDTGLVDLICKHGSTYTGRAPSNHPHPSLSPDGTKGIFVSNFMQAYPDVYQVVTRPPDPPRAAMISSNRLTWEPGERHLETRGYYVYRAETSGGPYRQVNAEPIREREMTLKEKGGFYVVTAVEPSRLESLPSPETCASRAWPGRVWRLLEAETCALDKDLRPRLAADTAVGMYGAGLREDSETGTLTMTTELPKAGSYRLLARTRNQGGLSLRTAEPPAPVTSTGESWAWREVASLSLEKGEASLSVALSGPIQVDQFLLTDEADLVPDGPVLLDTTAPEPPQAMRAVALDPFTTRLDWYPSESIDVAYYNVYCGDRKGYAPSQARRIGSPAEAEFVDWGLESDTTYYYRAVAVDRAGNESASCDVTLTTPRTPLHTATLEAEEGTLGVPAKVVEDTFAENKRAVEVPGGEKESSTLTIQFEVPRDGEYAIWAHAIPYRASKMMSVTLDEEKPFWWQIYNRLGGAHWSWCYVGSRSGNHDPGAYPRLFNLKKGAHRLQIVDTHGGIRIDRFVVTSDPHWEKNGFLALSITRDQP